MSVLNHGGSGEVVVLNRQAQEICSISKSLATPYNNVDEVPPFFGILFTLTAATDISIQTFELDVHLEAAGNDLAIEVYTISGDYAGIGDGVKYKNESSVWTPVAQTNGVVLPNGHGIVIPSTNFTAVQMKAYSRQSFYVTMRGPYIDSTVYGLSKTGDVYAQGADLNVLVGSGLSSYKFPAEIDPIVDPQFTGVIHYDKVGPCSDLLGSTTVEYLFLMNSNSPVDMDVNDALGKYIKESQVLQGYTQQNGLIQTAKATSERLPYLGTCPQEWSNCPSEYVRTRVAFRHRETLESPTLLFELYAAASLVTEATKKIVGGDNSIYIGLRSIRSNFEITVDGMTTGQVMTLSQQRYFSDVTAGYLTLTVDPELASGFDVVVLDEDFTANRLLRILQGPNTLTIRGEIHAEVYASLGWAQLDSTLNLAFSDNKQLYIELLKSGGIRPGDIVETDRTDFFSAVDNAKVFVHDPVLYEQAPPASGGTNLMVIVIVVSVLGLLILPVGLYFLRRHLMARADAKAHLEEYRARRQAEEKNRREEKQRRYAQLSEDPEQALSKDDASKSVSATDVGTQSFDEAGATFDTSPSVASSGSASLSSGRLPPGRSKSYDATRADGLEDFMAKQSKPLRNHLSCSRSIGPGSQLGGRNVSAEDSRTVGPGIAIPGGEPSQGPREDLLPKPPSLRKLMSDEVPEESDGNPLGFTEMQSQSRPESNRHAMATSVGGNTNPNGRAVSGSLAGFLDRTPRRADKEPSGSKSVGHLPQRKFLLQKAQSKGPPRSLPAESRRQKARSDDGILGTLAMVEEQSGSKRTEVSSRTRSLPVRSKSNNSASGDLTSFMDRQPHFDSSVPNGARSVNTNPNGRAVSGSLAGFLDRTPRTDKEPSGSKSVGHLPQRKFLLQKAQSQGPPRSLPAESRRQKARSDDGILGTLAMVEEQSGPKRTEVSSRTRSLPVRSKSNNGTSGDLTSFMDRQPHFDSYVPNGARSLGYTQGKLPAMERGSSGDLGNYMNRQAKPLSNLPSGAQSVGRFASGPERQPSMGSKGLPLAGYLDTQRRSPGRTMSGTQTVGPRLMSNGGPRAQSRRTKSSSFEDTEEFALTMGRSSGVRRSHSFDDTEDYFGTLKAPANMYAERPIERDRDQKSMVASIARFFDGPENSSMPGPSRNGIVRQDTR